MSTVHWNVRAVSSASPSLPLSPWEPVEGLKFRKTATTVFFESFFLREVRVCYSHIVPRLSFEDIRGAARFGLGPSVVSRCQIDCEVSQRICTIVRNAVEADRSAGGVSFPDVAYRQHSHEQQKAFTQRATTYRVAHESLLSGPSGAAESSSGNLYSCYFLSLD